MRATICIPLLLVGMAAGLLISESEIQAATITVNTTADEVSTNGQCSLREALDNANSDTAGRPDCVAGSGADTIDFSVTGTIVLGSELRVAFPSILTITGPGEGITLSGNGQRRVLLVDLGAVVELQNLTVTAGLAFGFDGGLITQSGGGGIRNLGRLTLTNSIVSGNAAGIGFLINPLFGGGIFNGGTLILINSTVSGNRADTNGGGIFNRGSLMLDESTISDNHTVWGDGGGIANGISLSPVRGGRVSLLASTISSNTARGNGGGIFNEGGGLVGPAAGFLTLIDSTISDNHSTATGGGLHNENLGHLTLANSTVQGNSSNSNGGGIFNRNLFISRGGGSRVTIINTTLSDNILSISRFPVSNNLTNIGGTITLSNTIVAHSSISGGNCTGPITDLGHNLQFPGASCGATIPSLNPLLGPLADNGGPTLTLALQANSPAINAGDTSVCLADPIDNQDQRGFTRIIEQSPFCDIGAFEFGKPIQHE